MKQMIKAALALDLGKSIFLLTILRMDTQLHTACMDIWNWTQLHGHTG